MSGLRGIAVLAAVAAFVMMASVQPAQAAPEPSSQASLSTTGSMPRHYAPGVVVESAGSDQCSRAVNQRRGAWLCLGNVAPHSGVCTALGCYEYGASYWASFDGSGNYGYGGTELGQTYFYVEDYFSGGSSTSKLFQFESTRGVQTVDATGERLYYSDAHPEGYPVSGGATYKEWGAHGPYGADTLVTAFGSGGYTAYEGSVAWAGIAHQFQWTDPSSAYPGTWWVWWKGPKFQRQSSGQYTVSNPPQIGSSPYGSGYTG